MLLNQLIMILQLVIIKTLQLKLTANMDMIKTTKIYHLANHSVFSNQIATLINTNNNTKVQIIVHLLQTLAQLTVHPQLIVQVTMAMDVHLMEVTDVPHTVIMGALHMVTTDALRLVLMVIVVPMVVLDVHLMDMVVSDAPLTVIVEPLVATDVLHMVMVVSDVLHMGVSDVHRTAATVVTDVHPI